MFLVNNKLVGEYEYPIFDYMPDSFIIKNVLQNKLKCYKIETDKGDNIINVYWKRS